MRKFLCIFVFLISSIAWAETTPSDILLGMFKLKPLQSMRFVGSVRYTPDTLGCSIMVLQENDAIEITVTTLVNNQFVFTVPKENQQQSLCDQVADSELCLTNKSGQQLSISSSAYPGIITSNILAATVVSGELSVEKCQVVAGSY